MRVYQVFAVETTPHGFSSDWQDHRQFKVMKTFVDEPKAKEFRDYLLSTKRYSAHIESFSVTE